MSITKHPRLLHAATIAAVAIMMMSCAVEERNDTPTTLSFGNSQYSELCVSHAIAVRVDSTATTITATIGQSISDRLEVKRRGNSLQIGLKNGTVAKSAISVTLPYNPSLRSIELSGASAFESPCTISADDVEIELSGASTIKATVQARQLDAEVSGSSVATLIGESNTLDLELSGASTLQGKQFGTAEADVEISGASTATFGCTTALRGEVSGASTLNYSGSPRVSVSTTGSSHVNAL